MARFGLHSTRVHVDGSLKDSTLIVNGKTIESVEPGSIRTDSFPVEDLGASVIMPGLIDSHVHVNEPGRTDWEGFDTATQAAAAGGITMLVDMPLNSTPVTTDVASLNLKLVAAKKSIHVNCGFYGGVVPDNCKLLEPLIDAGVFGIKAFLTHSGIDDFPNVTEQNLRAALPAIRNSNIPLLVHAELDSVHAGLKELEMNPASYQSFLKSRPREWEDRAINMLIRLCEETQARIHIVHLSSSNSIGPLQSAIKRGLPISVETCPHYLVFNSEDIPDAQTIFKCAPPIREKENNEKLWQAIKDKVISVIVTDHSPCLPEMKLVDSGNFQKAWGGIAGLQFSLPAFWTQARKRGFSIEQMAELMSTSVARFLNLDHRKGSLRKGFDADIAVWSPEREFKVTQESILHKHKISPYVGLTLNGVVERTYVNGNLVFDHGDFPNLNAGALILRK